MTGLVYLSTVRLISRRGQDLNLRTPLRVDGLANRCHKPDSTTPPKASKTPEAQQPRRTRTFKRLTCHGPSGTRTRSTGETIRRVQPINTIGPARFLLWVSTPASYAGRRFTGDVSSGEEDLNLRHPAPKAGTLTRLRYPQLMSGVLHPYGNQLRHWTLVPTNASRYSLPGFRRTYNDGNGLPLGTAGLEPATSGAKTRPSTN